MTEPRKNLALIGMPGSGKSTFGQAVAKAFAMAFIDTDDLIVDAFSKPLQDQLDEVGYLELRRREEAVISQLSCESTIIATGGSAVYGTTAMAHLAESSVIAYLEVSEAELLRRIDNMATRGIAKAEGQSFSEMMQERVALYQHYADVTLCAENPDDVPVILEQVRALLSQI